MEHGKILRLQAADKIGSTHIAVKRHTALDYPQHWHNYFELEIVVNGHGTHVFNGIEYRMEKGDAYLLTPVDFHRIEAESPVELLNVSFDEVWLSENMRTLLYTADFPKTRKLDEHEYERMLMCAKLLELECKADRMCAEKLLEYLLGRFMVKPQPFASQAELTGIKKAVAYIELHFREKITLEKLARMAGYSPAYFSTLFRNFTGETYMERVTALRIRYAKALLANGVSVSDACFESGFGSLSNFLSVFKANCGVSPSMYKKTSLR